MKIRFNLDDFLTELPGSTLSASDNPDEQIKKLTETAAIKAAAVSATLSAPGGFIGVLSALPDLAAIWRIQAQLVADIAATYGKLGYLTKKSLIWCLCKQSGVQIVRDIAVRAGTHLFIKKAPLKVLSRAVPVIGAIGGAAYAAFDTYSVSKTAKAFFSGLKTENSESKEPSNEASA